MARVDMKALRERLNNTCIRALEAAAGTCINRTHYEITIEHVLAPLLDMGNCDLLCICDHFKVDVSKLRGAINRALEELKTGNSGRPQFSPFLADWLSDGWQTSSLELAQPAVRTGALVLALVRNLNRAYFTDYTDEFTKIAENELKSKFGDITAASTEAQPAPGEESRTARGAAQQSTGEALQQFTYDLTERARDGKIDPVIGREREIRQCIDILMRRYQNNPLIIGDPGTGKTAIAEGFAMRLVAGDVPPVLANITLLCLDVGQLSAGANVKGEFERRLKGVIAEVGASNAAGKPIILFIDEAHMLIGAGAGTDAAQLLKPALARGELRTVAATTSAEYKKYFEKDPPFAQRFGLIRLGEPSVEVAIDMLRGTKDKFEKHHKVRILDSAIRSAVSMSNQYLTESALPRKAVSLLDTSAARVAVGLSSTPGALEDIRRRIIQLDVAIKAIERDAEAGHTHDPDEVESLKTERAERQRAYEELDVAWKKEKELAQRVIKLREEILAVEADAEAGAPAAIPEANPQAVAKAASADADQKHDRDQSRDRKGAGDSGAASAAPPKRPIDEVRKDLDAANKALEAQRGDGDTLVPLQVDDEIVANVLSDWTGIPAGNMVKDTAEAMLTFESRIGKRVIGQDHAMSEIGKRLRIAASKLQDPSLPLAVFLLVGPSGTGKTETALAVADLIFGGDRFMTSINMTEYSSSMNVSRLIGSAPGLVGFGEGGVLTEAVRQRPYSVVLLDEMEKAHMDVNLLFMQVFDKGALTDSEGRVANFKNTVIMMTSNEGSSMVMDMCADGEEPTLDELRKGMQPILEQRFTPAFVGRTTVIPFYPLSPAVLRKITDLKMNKIAKRLLEQYKLKLELTPAVGDEIGRRCQQITIGARLINLIINETVLPAISTKVLEMMGDTHAQEKLIVDCVDGEFTYTFA